jgi:cold shock CspA family protein
VSTQGTVEAFDPGTRSGSVLLDDGVRLPFGSVAFARAGLRTLRLGQRVRLEITGDDNPRVTALTIVTLPLRD